MSGIFSDGELDDMREVLEAHMPDLANILGSGNPYTDGRGGWPSSDSVATYTDVPCLVMPIASDELSPEQRETDTTWFTISFPYGTSVQIGDRLILTTLGEEAVRVTRVWTQPESWDIYVKCEAVLQR